MLSPSPGKRENVGRVTWLLHYHEGSLILPESSRKPMIPCRVCCFGDTRHIKNLRKKLPTTRMSPKQLICKVPFPFMAVKLFFENRTRQQKCMPRIGENRVSGVKINFLRERTNEEIKDALRKRQVLQSMTKQFLSPTMHLHTAVCQSDTMSTCRL